MVASGAESWGNLFTWSKNNAKGEAAGRSCNYAFLLERGNAEGHILLPSRLSRLMKRK
jgi:hypothetical protein